ncbi:ABC transporter permease subunit [Acidisoma cellulosilytica]|uniref:ABC transporter permease subunit n=1 Tax=Acidisoma cellulosilyticum TaxID=2802395 RepID=A0A963Z3Q7_9PROT|nr:ABC transporter permease subunit [Acidisoma cellulosilyticum]MCB8881352.1 ABC transporter permease subunit [Acidisoma cellulosilyticum]
MKPLSPSRRRAIGLIVLLCLAAIWQLLSMIYPAEAQPGEPMIAGWQVIFTKTLLSLSDYWQGGLGVRSVAEGASRGYAAACLTLIVNSAITLARVLGGLAIGTLLGMIGGLAVSWSSWGRRIVNLPMQFLRTLPLLAMVPLFQLWFGTNLFGQIAFTAYGVSVIVFAGTVNAVANIPAIFIDNARSLGASQSQIYRSVILPGILPGMRSTILLALGTAWSAVLGAEYLGAQSGLGYIIVYAQQFAYLDRMFLVALVILVFAAVFYTLFDRATRKLLAWAPQTSRREIAR